MNWIISFLVYHQTAVLWLMAVGLVYILGYGVVLFRQARRGYGASIAAVTQVCDSSLSYLCSAVAWVISLCVIVELYLAQLQLLCALYVVLCTLGALCNLVLVPRLVNLYLTNQRYPLSAEESHQMLRAAFEVATSDRVPSNTGFHENLHRAMLSAPVRQEDRA